MKLTQQQQLVLKQIKEFMDSDASIFILRGYAGTGKTTMIKMIADYICQFRTLVLMAPTGRAARVLEQKTGYPATTIHKAIYAEAVLQLKPVKDLAESEFKLKFPINNTDGKIVAIVDEASMVCSRKMEQELYEFGTDNLMDDLLTFVRPSYGGKVIFVGDPAQLPPVGESFSMALCAEFFKEKGLNVMETELTEVLRQTGDSVILKNAMQIRDLLSGKKRNRLVFDEKKNDVESIPSGLLMEKYLEERRKDISDNSVIICYTNQSAAFYNKDIRKALYKEEEPPLKVGDVLLITQNNYQLNLMNGEFVKVLYVGEKSQQSASVYVQEGGSRVRKNFTFEFVHIQISNDEGLQDCMLLLNLLNSEYGSLSIDESRALYINFRMRNPNLKPGTEDFKKALLSDTFFNCLKVKYGYAVTGHKCQGGEWEKVFVDYNGRTGLSDDCLRWAYTATTRAQNVLYVTNLPHITPFSKFKIESIQQCSKMNEEFRVLGEVESSPFHATSAPKYLHAKYMCIKNNMDWTPYKVLRVESKPYLEIYHVQTPDGVERYDIRYKKGGLFLKAVPQTLSAHSVMVEMMLNDENVMPLIMDYMPSDDMHEKLYNMIRSACDGLNIRITNVVEHKEYYHVMYYFQTSGCVSNLMVYIDASGFVSYAKPMSMIGQNDQELKLLIDEIQTHFE